ncbi:AMP-binding protein [Variovorax sp. J22P168]|uniref:AMP-binding protein n=1 Tax=Variovorax jilinensis TaxID=3053513 RepID=UPI002575C966|nr:AMP-binding protein [Variovorax sp. J22P168]MDM0014924.1 AMP-binding protein [Variovorax sp. J22P168]
MTTKAAPNLWEVLVAKGLTTVPAVIAAQALARPDAIALRTEGAPPLNYRALHLKACAIAAGLRGAGVRRGDTVVLFGPNSADIVACWIAVNVLGAIEVCINTANRGAPLVHALNNAQARHIVVAAELLKYVVQVGDQLDHLEHACIFEEGSAEVPSHRFRSTLLSDLLRPERATAIEEEIRSESGDVAPSNIASIIYTSGTTGPAKGVLMPHAQVCLLAAMSVRGLKLTEDDVFHCFHPMFHMAGKFMGILATFIAGGQAVLDRAFDAEHWLVKLRTHGITAGLAHGPMVEMIHAQPARPDDQDNPLRRMIVAPFPTRIATDFERRFDVRGIEVWGMTEVGVPIWCDVDRPLRPGSCGRNDDELFDVAIVDPVTDEDVAPGEVGELVVRPRLPWVLMQGYMGMHEETVATWRNLWFHSGDSARRDADGNHFFIDRLKDRIRRRAENISSYEIESAALSYPPVAEAAAVGVPSQFHDDDDIKLTIVVQPKMALREQDLLAHLAGCLPHYMLPRYIERLEALPRTPTNKVRKAELRARGVDAAVWDRKAIGIEVKSLYEN